MFYRFLPGLDNIFYWVYSLRFHVELICNAIDYLTWWVNPFEMWMSSVVLIFMSNLESQLAYFEINFVASFEIRFEWMESRVCRMQWLLWLTEHTINYLINQIINLSFWHCWPSAWRVLVLTLSEYNISSQVFNQSQFAV